MFARFASMLCDQGWRAIIPLRAGEKRPAIPGWQRFNRKPPDDAQIGEWIRKHPDGGVGLAYGPDNVVGVDLDWVDPATAAAAWGITCDILGPTPLIRIGLPPKRLALYRAEPGMAPIGKSFGGFEFYTRSAQTVLFGIHPVAGRPYEWPGLSPLHLSPGDLPVVSHDRLSALISKLAPYRVASPRGTGSSQVQGRLGRPMAGLAGRFGVGLLKRLRGAPEPIAEAARLLDEAPFGMRHYTAVGLVTALMELGRSDRAIREALLPIYLNLTAVAERKQAERRFMNAIAWGRERVGPDDETLMADPALARLSEAWRAGRSAG